MTEEMFKIGAEVFFIINNSEGADASEVDIEYKAGVIRNGIYWEGREGYMITVGQDVFKVAGNMIYKEEGDARLALQSLASSLEDKRIKEIEDRNKRAKELGEERFRIGDVVHYVYGSGGKIIGIPVLFTAQEGVITDIIFGTEGFIFKVNGGDKQSADLFFSRKEAMEEAKKMARKIKEEEEASLKRWAKNKLEIQKIGKEENIPEDDMRSLIRDDTSAQQLKEIKARGGKRWQKGNEYIGYIELLKRRWGRRRYG